MASDDPCASHFRLSFSCRHCKINGIPLPISILAAGFGILIPCGLQQFRAHLLGIIRCQSKYREKQTSLVFTPCRGMNSGSSLSIFQYRQRPFRRWVVSFYSGPQASRGNPLLGSSSFLLHTRRVITRKLELPGPRSQRGHWERVEVFISWFSRSLSCSHAPAWEPNRGAPAPQFTPVPKRREGTPFLEAPASRCIPEESSLGSWSFPDRVPKQSLGTSEKQESVHERHASFLRAPFTRSLVPNVLVGNAVPEAPASYPITLRLPLSANIDQSRLPPDNSGCSNNANAPVDPRSLAPPDYSGCNPSSGA